MDLRSLTRRVDELLEETQNEIETLDRNLGVSEITYHQGKCEGITAVLRILLDESNKQTRLVEAEAKLRGLALPKFGGG